MDNIVEKKANNLIQIDVAAILKARRVKLPKWIVRRIEKLICQDELNRLLAEIYPKRGADFSRGLMEQLNITIESEGSLPDANNRRVIIVSNHPLGGLDGIALIDYVRNHYKCEPLFVVNDLLMAVEPLNEVFLPINKHGSQSREAVRAIDKAMESDVPVLIFPAGMCSRRRDGKIADLEWKKMFVQKAREFSRDIVPLRFEAQNSDRFYRIARLRERLGIKFNVEMILLPSEMIKAKGKTFKIICSKPIKVDELSDNLKAETARVRQIVDNLKPILKEK